jgi:hypothetical protein
MHMMLYYALMMLIMQLLKWAGAYYALIMLIMQFLGHDTNTCYRGDL